MNSKTVSMEKIISLPLVYQDKEWQTIIRACRNAEGWQLRVNILSSKLSRQLGSSNLFVMTRGALKAYSFNGHSIQLTGLQQKVYEMLQQYFQHHPIA